MDKHTDKFLLVILVLALVISPLRGADAVTAPVSADEVSHCTEMRHTMDSRIHADGIKHPVAASAGHCCGHGCDRTCCDDACVHPSLALTGATPQDSSPARHDLHMMIPHHYSGCTVSPPFRPPIFLPG
jgi:hypothetical protein